MVRKIKTYYAASETGCRAEMCVFKSCVCLCVCADVEVDVDELNQEQVLDLNKMATPYGMAEGDFVR